MPLSGRDRRFLRALGHALDPVVQVGKLGLTGGVTAAVDEALATHELVKVRVGTESPDDPETVAEGMAPALGAEIAQVLGRTVLLYRKHPTRPRLRLPRVGETAQGALEANRRRAEERSSGAGSEKARSKPPRRPKSRPRTARET